MPVGADCQPFPDHAFLQVYGALGRCLERRSFDEPSLITSNVAVATAATTKSSAEKKLVLNTLKDLSERGVAPKGYGERII